VPVPFLHVSTAEWRGFRNSSRFTTIRLSLLSDDEFMSSCAVRVDRGHVYRDGFHYLRQFLDFNIKRIFIIDV
jgi:hypothetical protein